MHQHKAREFLVRFGVDQHATNPKCLIVWAGRRHTWSCFDTALPLLW